jgi:phosphatidylinositol glycan class K
MVADKVSLQRQRQRQRRWPRTMMLVTVALILISLFDGTLSSSLQVASPTPNIHAVIVSSSRYWFNYRHAINALGMYNVLKANGVPDDQIVLMVADEYATNSRNPYKNGMYANGVTGDSWYSEDTELDYRGADVTVQNFLDAVLGTAPKSLEHTDAESHLLIYVTGHGGDQFFKFQDEEELTAQDIANMLEELYRRKKFGKALVIADTCQAFTLFDKVQTPNVWALGTSLRGENAYAHHSDKQLGLSVIERWTKGFLEHYAKAKTNRRATLNDVMAAPFEGKAPLGAHVGTYGNFSSVLVSDFFGSKPPTRSSTGSSSFGKRTIAAVEPSAAYTIRPPERFETKIMWQAPIAEAAVDKKESQEDAFWEPTDSSFGYLVFGLVAAVLLTSRFGKSQPLKP